MILKKTFSLNSSTLEIVADERCGEIVIESLKIITHYENGVPKYFIDADVIMEVPGFEQLLESLDWSEEISNACDGISDEDYQQAMEDFKSKLSVAESLVIPMPVTKISKQYYQS